MESREKVDELRAQKATIFGYFPELRASDVLEGSE